MKNVDIIESVARFEAADLLAGFVIPRIAARGHDHGYRRPLIPLQCGILHPAIDRCLEQRQQIRLQARQDRLRFRVSEAAVELEHSRTLGRHH
jgi:hypothetical protein